VNPALSLIEPTDGGILEDLAKEIIRDGEKRLMLAVLESATEDFQKYLLAKDKRGQELFRNSEAWILDSDNESLFSFDNICEHLRLDASYLRQGFMRWKAARLAELATRCSRNTHRRAV